MLAGNQPPLAVTRQPIGMIRRLPEHRKPAGRLVPAHDAVVGDVAAQQVTPVAERALPVQATAQSLVVAVVGETLQSVTFDGIAVQPALGARITFAERFHVGIEPFGVDVLHTFPPKLTTNAEDTIVAFQIAIFGGARF